MATSSNKEKIFLTGAAGYVGAMLARELSKNPEVLEIICLDKDKMPELLNGNKKIFWVTANTADSIWQRKVAERNPSIVIHAAWQIREMYLKKALQWRWNVEGSDRVFDFAFSTPSVKKLVYFSTVASYGAFSENKIEEVFTEEDSFRPTDYLYAEEKRVVETRLRRKFEGLRGKRPDVAIVRPAAITGPRGRSMTSRFGLQSALSGTLKGSVVYDIVSFMVSFVPVTKKWCRQFVHEDDVADIVSLLALNKGKREYEIFNLSGPGPVVRGADMAKAVGKKAVPVHPLVIRLVFFFMWHLSLGKIPTSKGGWKSYSYPIAVDGSKITKEYGYQYKFPTKEAFVKNEGRYAVK